MTDTDSGRSVPSLALLLSLGALGVPVVLAFNAPGWMGGDVGVLIWLTALVPAFLLTFYKGWRGVSLALAFGMAALTLTQVALLLVGAPEPNWIFLGAVVLVFVGVSLGLGYFADLLQRERQKAERQALTDPLTGMPNRRHADIFLEAGFSAAQRGTPLSVVLFDLDRFKSFNDSFGHPAGDEILKEFGRILLDNTRRMNVSARYGGEEFIAVLSNCRGKGATVFARRVCQQLRDTDFPWGRVTVSAGVAAHEKGMGSPDVLVAAADRALYRAKEGGRDRVEVQESDVTRASLAPAAAARRRKVTGLVVVVDDDPTVARSLGKMLDALGHRHRIYTDPTEALEWMEKSRIAPDLLVCDVVMPGMNGLTLVEKVSRLGADLPVLYMSGYVQGEVTWPGVPGAETAFLQKPVDVEELDRTVRDLLARGSGGGELRVVPPFHEGAGKDDGDPVGERKGSV